jgi:hypothetical protein
MSLSRRIERLEVEAHRRHVARYVPQGWTLDRFLDAAIAWLEMPLQERRERMPMFSEAEHIEIAVRLPKYRRLRRR